MNTDNIITYRPWLISLGCFLLVVALVTACGEEAKPPEKSSEKVTRGVIRLKDRSIKVVPFVSHEPKMDIFTSCKAMVEKAKEAGKKDVALCYDPTPGKPLTVRVESYDRKGLQAARRRLPSKNEAVHFVIEASGSIYQILDLAYSPRRDEKIRPGEIRILSGQEKARIRLIKALKTFLPGLQVETISAPVRKDETSKR